MQFRACDDFLEYVERTRDHKTYLAYSNDLRQFEAWLKSRKKTLSKVDDAVVRDYLGYLQRSLGRTAWSTHRAATSLRQLFKFMDRPLPKSIYPIKHVEKGLPSTRRALTQRQMDRLFEVIGDDSPTALRDRAAFMLMYGLGFVVKDVLDMNLDQISLREKLIRPFGKSGNKRMTPRVVPLGGEVFDALSAWLGPEGRPSLELNRGVRIDRRAVFVGVSGRRLSRQGLTHILKQRGAEAGLDERLSPIWLRDSFVKHMHLSGATIDDINLISGSIAFVGPARNTRAYVDHARKVLEAHHPYWA